MEYTVTVINGCPMRLTRVDGPSIVLEPGKPYPVSEQVARDLDGRAAFKIEPTPPSEAETVDPPAAPVQEINAPEGDEGD